MNFGDFAEYLKSRRGKITNKVREGKSFANFLIPYNMHDEFIRGQVHESFEPNEIVLINNVLFNLEQKICIRAENRRLGILRKTSSRGDHITVFSTNWGHPALHLWRAT